MPYEILDHTADIKASLEAAELQGLYQSAIDLLRHVLVGASDVEPAITKEIGALASEPSEQFYRFVRELVYLYDVERFVPARIAAMDPLAVAGATFDPRKHAYEHQLKAVTRHQYLFEQGEEGYRAEIVFDL